MTPKEKAEELVYKFMIEIATIYSDGTHPESKQCALICVEEIINQLDDIRKPEYTTFMDYSGLPIHTDGYDRIDYWQQVKQCLNEL